MKIIKPSATELKQTDLFKHIELCGRTCYKSEDKITDGSAEKFVNMLRSHAHGAMLEHGTVYLTVFITAADKETFSYRDDIIRKLRKNPYTRFNHRLDDGNYYYFTTNYRVIVENGWEDIMQEFQSECTEYHPKRRTFKITCNRGVSHEFVRHRVFSFAQESQRYVSSCEKKCIKEFNCDSISDIIEAYNQGFSMREISLNSINSEWEIRKILLKNNIKLRPHGSKGSKDENFFKIIDTPEKAYLLGIIQTDGNVHRNKYGATLCISQNSDINWYIKLMLNSITDQLTITPYNKGKCENICVQSKEIVNDIINLGVVPNKTKTQTNENIDTLWNSIPSNYKKDFIRGLIDGDGCIRFFVQPKCKNESANLTFASVQEHLIDLVKNYFETILNCNITKRNQGKMFSIWVTDKNKMKILGEHLFENFKYPFGNPKKVSAWVSRLEHQNYPIADYNDEKFKVILPYWVQDNSPYIKYEWVKAMNIAEIAYKNLRISGLTPQLARGVLPNDTKTELIMTGFESDWEHFFNLRCAKDAHPEAQEIANMIKEQF